MVAKMDADVQGNAHYLTDGSGVLSVLDLKNNPDVQKLIKIGQKDREITINTIHKILPADIVTHEDIIDNIFLILNEFGIEIIDEYHIKPEEKSKETATLQDKEMHELLEKLAEDNRKLDDPIRLYLKDIGKVRLLTKEEERDLAMQIEQGEKELTDVVHEVEITFDTVEDRIKKVKEGTDVDLIFDVLHPPRVYNVSAIEKKKLKDRYQIFERQFQKLLENKRKLYDDKKEWNNQSIKHNKIKKKSPTYSSRK